MTTTAVREAGPPAPIEEAGVDRRRLSLLAAGHAVTDSYGQSLLSPLFPTIAARLGLGLGEIGVLASIMGLSASLGQPLWGFVSDRFPRLKLVAYGPALAAVCCTMVGIAPNYWTLAVCLLLTGMGVGAFHPQGASLARQASRGRGFAMSAFTVGGNIGFGLAPLLSFAYLYLFGLRHFYFAAIPGLLFALFMARQLQHAERAAPPLPTKPTHAKQRGNPVALTFLTLTVMLRSGVQVGMITYLPFLVEERYGTREVGVKSAVVAAFLLASAVSGPIGGHLCDRYGRRAVMMGSLLAAPWPMLLAFAMPGYGTIALLALGGFILMLPHPANVVMAQEFMPRSAGIGASMITGFAFGLAQLFNPLIGWMGEAWGVQWALGVMCLTPLAGVLLVLPIPERHEG